MPSTTQEHNVAVARRGYEAFERGDTEGFLELVAPDVVFRDSAALPDPGVHEGRSGLLRAADEERDYQEGWTIRAERILPAGDDHVVVLLEQRGVGRQSGLDLSHRLAHVWRMEDGRGVEATAYSSWGDALAAVGLEPAG